MGSQAQGSKFGCPKKSQDCAIGTSHGVRCFKQSMLDGSVEPMNQTPHCCRKERIKAKVLALAKDYTVLP